uniref:Putative phosphate ABC transporter, ATP binding subunit n=1 Tax=Paulinella chromatophora TaxID=39717 RepID=B1X3U5_PAUCH|nr:putative phosphate ABC transporter, ATP binding subunit [Paulinella chromatophora]ACB42614.1 putative phosphate ABC transporter, ATP binding subunit [Paulinella chromatophora]|eukprot:gb/GEZN01005360.1/.p2 GENE.gb/GEZN01005360.1/~~gb/GEZN01005360.1/.p2  ORF type:complete len:285 (-),score=-9.16 gb/GEZN01005360.1/:85-939(-)
MVEPLILPRQEHKEGPLILPIRQIGIDKTCISIQNFTVRYGKVDIVRDIYCDIPYGKVTAFIGPSGCGKSTMLRSINRMNDLTKGFNTLGRIVYKGQDVYSREVDPVELRRRIGMVFQRPCPLPKRSIYENIAFGPRLNGYIGNLDDLVESSLRKACIWEETKDKLHLEATFLSGGQQQRLCIARTVAVEPDVILMDEPCSSLDPRSGLKVEDLILELKRQYTIIIVTHDMTQAMRVADMTAFFNATPRDDGMGQIGNLIEFEPTKQLFKRPKRVETCEFLTTG